MKKAKKELKTVPNIFYLIINSSDELTVTKYENTLICMFSSPIMFILAAANYIKRYLILHEEFKNVLPDIIIFTFFGLMFEALLRYKKIPVILKTVLLSINFSLIIFFVVIRYYETMDNSVWTVAFILIVVSLIRSNRTMLFFVGLSSLICIIYTVFKFGYKDIEITSYYFFSQIFLFIILFIVSFTVNAMNTSRFSRINKQYSDLAMQEEEISALYEEIAATEEELREQNVKLGEYNKQIKENEGRLYHMAYYDTLTGLPNRKMIKEELDMLVEMSEMQSTTFYLVLIDLDNFKETNDTLGHTFGDLFIRSVAENIRMKIDEEDILGRIDGDEFALIISRELNEEQVFSYVDSIRKNLMDTFFVENREAYVTASFGISMFPRDGNNSMELFKSADTSMYKAKELGKNNVQLFNENMKHEIDNKVKIEHCLIKGVKNDELFVVYQPQYFFNSQKLRGFEVLLRWNSPELGNISPMEFIPIAEETRLIIPLGDWVLKTACKKHKMLKDMYNFDAIISVNVSTIQIKHKGFIESVKKALEISGLEPGHLEIEITESVFIESLNETIILLEKLKDLGVRIALDDFGTGYSSLSYLRRLPLDTLKIDKSFIKDIKLQSISKKIIGDFISIAHHMGIFVIAEGVEHDYQFEHLKSLGCDGVQGFLLCKPLEEEDLEQMIENSLKDTSM